MAETVGQIAEPVCSCITATGLPDAIGREAYSFFYLESNLRALEKADEDMRAVEAFIKAQVDAEINMLKECVPEVDLWLKRVLHLSIDAIEEEYDNLARRSCICNCTLDIAGRHRLGKRIAKMLDEVNSLTKAGREFTTFGYTPLPKPIEDRPRADTVGMEPVLRQLCGLFDKDDVSVIGVWGQGGVGKTTLLNVFNNDLKTRDFDYQVVILIEVSNSETLNVIEMQRTITDRLGLPWNDTETEDARAKLLLQTLSRKRCVILLDDVRKKFPLEKVGIPNPDRENKSKLVLTTRYKDVCYQMGAQRSLIEMQLLNEEASWNLFRSNLSNDAIAAIDSPEPDNVIRKHAMTIARSCGGLPLALNVIGTAVAGLKFPREWSSAVDAMNSNMLEFTGVDEMFLTLKYSYDKLTPTQQKCFLYCILFPEYGSTSKEQLLNYWMAEGSIIQDHTKGEQIIRNLVSACLLQESGFESSKVKMHHVIRHFGLWLATTQERFVVQAGMALESASSPKDWKEATRISLMSNNIKALSISPKCKNLTTLLVQNNRNLDRLGPGFFKSMSSLKVLDLSHTAIKELPDCESLVALQHLNLSHTNITKLPERLWLLRDLIHLDLSVTVELEDTFDNCSKLYKLRVLNLFRSHYGIRDVDNLNLDSLKFLQFLGITVYAEDVLRKLNKTHPLAKPTHCLNLKYCEAMKSICVSDFNLMEQLEELYIESCYDLIELVADADEPKASHLKLLTLTVLPVLESITIGPAPHQFRNIRKLVISSCPKLRNVSWVSRLEALERLWISNCDGLEHVVQETPNTVQSEKGQLPGAEMSATTVNNVSQEHQIDELAEESPTDWTKGHQNKLKSDVLMDGNGWCNLGFLKLRVMNLNDLKNLVGICSPRYFPSLETIKVVGCPNLRSIPLDCTYDCKKLKQVCGSSDWWHNLQWENNNTKASIEEYFVPI